MRGDRNVKILKNKSGYEMVEASITMPIIILTTILLLRVFTFYLEILNSGIKLHERAIAASINSKEDGLRIYRKNSEIIMLRTGILKFDLKKKIAIKTYIYNEDKIIRAGELLENK